MAEVCAENKGFLYCQTRDWLIRQMRTGKLKPGSRLPGERVLANSLNISRCTARTALRGLEEEGFIERIPSRGAFIKQQGEIRQIKLALVFPEAEISIDYLSYSNLMANLVFQQGLLKSCIQNNASLSFIHCDPEKCSEAHSHYAEKFCDRLMNEFDGAVFVSSQLVEIRQHLLEHNFPMINLGGTGLLSGEKGMSYNREEICKQAAEYLIEKGCRQVVMLIQSEQIENSWKTKLEPVKEAFTEAGIDFSMSNILYVEAKEEDIYQKLKSEYKTHDLLPDAFFCTTRQQGTALLHLAGEMGWAVPEDFIIIGYGNSPEIARYAAVNEISYIQPPLLETGITAGDLLINSILSNKEIPDITIIKGKIIHAKNKYERTTR